MFLLHATARGQEVAPMPEKSHWPFGEGEAAQGASGPGHSKDAEAEKARLAEHATLRQRMRLNRLIVGGRAHTRKSGLS